jgi:hypothetical protein
MGSDDGYAFAVVSEYAREELLLVDWRTVRMLSIDGRTVHIVTEKDGARSFEFASESEAREALDKWMMGAMGSEDKA